MSNIGPPSAGAGQSTTGFTPQPVATPGAGSAAASNTAPASSSAPAPANNQNLNQIVTDYLLKKGYTRTEAEFRKEISKVDAAAKSLDPEENKLPEKYLQAIKELEKWVETSLDIYKFEVGKVLWPVFVYSFLDLVKLDHLYYAAKLMQQYKARFEKVHADEVRSLALITSPKQLEEDPIAQLYLKNKYRIPLNEFVVGTLFSFLERHSEKVGDITVYILSTYCEVEPIKRGPIEPFSFEAIYRRARNLEPDDADAQEGVPGIVTTTGSFTLNKEILDNNNKAALKLGPLPIDPDLRADTLLELEEEDKFHPPQDGARTLVEEFNSIHPIKREAGDSPQRTDIPYPPSRARDIVMEMQKVRENRDRFKIEGRTGGVGPGISVCMYTIHNSLGTVTCMDFSKDQKLVAVGTSDSYIRVWSLDGEPLKSQLPADMDIKANNRKLVGHSGPVYSIAFSDSIANIDRNILDEGTKPDTDAKLLISCSADGQVRLWSLETWSCLCIYKGHDGPVLTISWGPHGHYFATGGWDKTVRIWSQDHASAARLLVGHDTSISALAWHPNGAYVFSASDEADKTIRMWSVANGDCVRIFTGHLDYISALEVSPNGKILASADIGGNIYLWDIANTKRIKRCRGHGRGGIWSLSFSVESNTLVSGGQDNTVRVWDVEMPAEGARTVTQADGSDGTIVAAGGGAGGDGKATGAAAQAAAGGAGASGGTGKKKGKEVMITPDQISAFPTKRTPVQKVQFTRMNLVIAGGCYEQER